MCCNNFELTCLRIKEFISKCEKIHPVVVELKHADRHSFLKALK